MRLFLGINPTSKIKLSIHQYLLPMQVSPKGWVDYHDYHQTLLFIVEVSEKSMQEIEDRMENIQYHSFKIKTSGIKFFNRRIMYLEFSASDELNELKKIINKAFQDWAEKELKTFLPHITIKRWQRYEYAHLEKSIKASPVPTWEIEVKGLSLFKSEKNDMNQKYHEIKFVRFKD